MGWVRLGLGCTHHSTQQLRMLNRVTCCQRGYTGFQLLWLRYSSNRMGQSRRIWSRLGCHVGAIMSIEDLLDLTKFGRNISEISINPQISSRTQWRTMEIGEGRRDLSVRSGSSDFEEETSHHQILKKENCYRLPH